MKRKLTLSQVQEIQSLRDQDITIPTWIKKMKDLAKKLNLTDREILEVFRGDLF